MANVFPLKIAICGKIRSGKDTVAVTLCSIHGFKMYRFAAGILEVGKLLFPEDFKGFHKPRRLLQEIGQKMREIDPNVWINYTLNQIASDNAERVVITDLRQPNEYEALRKAGYFIIRVSADEKIRIERAIASGDNFTKSDLYHVTESHIDSFEVDFEIENNGTQFELFEQTTKAFRAALEARERKVSEATKES